MTQAQSKIYVLDTNILLHEPLAFLSFQEHDVVIPMTVLEELDHIKDSKKDVARDARVSIRALENVLADASPEQMAVGVMLAGLGSKEHGPSGRLRIYTDLLMEPNKQVFTSNENDNRIQFGRRRLSLHNPNTYGHSVR